VTGLVFGRCRHAQPVDTLLHQIQGPASTRLLIFGVVWILAGPACRFISLNHSTATISTASLFRMRKTNKNAEPMPDLRIGDQHHDWRASLSLVIAPKTIMKLGTKNLVRAHHKLGTKTKPHRAHRNSFPFSKPSRKKIMIMLLSFSEPTTVLCSLQAHDMLAMSTTSQVAFVIGCAVSGIAFGMVWPLMSSF
jgi:hypothetical protein